ncbi:MAG: hypothetical protein AAB694_01580 [Patescibacteria group bacterium]
MSAELPRWTFDATGKPQDLIHNGQIVLQDGRPVFAENNGVTFEEGRRSNALLVIREPGSFLSSLYILRREEGNLRLIQKSIERRLALVPLSGQIDGNGRSFTIPDMSSVLRQIRLRLEKLPGTSQ